MSAKTFHPPKLWDGIYREQNVVLRRLAEEMHQMLYGKEGVAHPAIDNVSDHNMPHICEALLRENEQIKP